MTHPTKAIYKILMTDYVKVSSMTEEIPFNDIDLKKSSEKIEQIKYHEKLEHKGIKFCCYNAGHVLGAAMFMIEIAGVKILYTGDFSRQEDRHLMGAETPPVNVDILIIESTYGVQVHEPRLEREKRFTSSIHEVVKRGGRCLIPVFALGRAQELLLILDEYWIAHPELQKIPIYYASALARKCMSVYQTYINMMNERIRAQFDLSNPFSFKHIENISGIERFTDDGPCVFMASPGMLQSGLSRQLFERWCSDKMNGVVIPGYNVEGTLAKHIMSEPDEITRTDGVNVPLHLTVTYVSFSAHSDFLQTSEFIQEIHPPHVVLVHGDANEMSRLKTSLIAKFKTINIMTPKNTHIVQMEFRAEKVAKMLGAIAANPPRESKKIAGLLVTKDFTHHIIAPSDLHNYTNLKINTIKQKQTVPFAQKYLLLSSTLEQLYDEMEESKTKDDKPTIKIYGSILITYNVGSHVTIEWDSNPVTDMVADSIVALIMQIESNPFSLRVKSSKENNGDIILTDEQSSSSGIPLVKMEKENEQDEEDLTIMTKSRKKSQQLTLRTEIMTMLSKQFSELKPDQDDPLLMHLHIDDDKSASIHLETLKVHSNTPELKTQIEKAIRRISLAVHPISFNINPYLNNNNNNNHSTTNQTNTTLDIKNRNFIDI
ncbi:beta-lactamase domain-containing protein [Heterostelium album PN500]|uniref:Beta-lactamase domain-containing protein n=1 Tax=Heterostelium pallidum (strain ATCC 26659 / Pp 5 / PN500) TaxID=670386 RepID=D3BEC2_HETP5|nr:beta-lactamase domain-containing protein [Heterostelium album PN500]EFA80253.1 beta-lactamase domain-containing protein [Heterostelium album PN500]|eukprot:XP_020432373.1 beta-lactamase domain-containing protein [Heterostelium album PN500]